MIELKDLGTFESVLHIVTDIVTGNIRALENALANGWDISQLIEIDEYSEHTPFRISFGYVLLAKHSMVSREWR